MPLPDNATAAWPPPSEDKAARLYRQWAAWWVGDTSELARVYSSAVGFSDPVIGGGDRRGGLVALAPRLFHGAPAGKGSLQSVKLHIPLASDIAMTSADLLFGEPPALVAVKDDAASRDPGTAATTSPTQERLDQYMANGLQAALLEAAEIAAAFGGVYLRVGWDGEIADQPLFDAIAPDTAVPQFRSGQLTAVTFHRVLPGVGDGNTWRHLERHENGRILHGLYCSGDDKTLGRRMPLRDHPETQAFAALVGGGDSVETGAKGLCVQYVPNMRPNRRIRGSQLGRSDFDGVVPVMDALDESWSSWLRDLRIGKGRVMVPEVYLDSAGRGQGALFDMEQEVFQVVNALPGAASGLAMTPVQFQIRVAEHQQTCAALTEQAVRGAGYSAQSFGMQGDGAMATATEVNARQSRSFMTRGKKINYWRPPLARLARAALEIDVRQFKPAGVVAALPNVEWPDGIAVDPQTLAQTLQLLKGAEAASTRTRVEILHPEWDGERVAAEVELIEKEGAPPADPQIGPPGTTVGAPAGNTAGQPGAATRAAANGGAENGEQPPATNRPAPATASGLGQTPTGNTPATAPVTGRPAPRARPTARTARR